MKRTILTAALVALTGPAFADGHLGPGDPEAGAESFSKCQSCHVVQNADGEVLAGRNGKTGPNLHGVVGRQAGSVDGFRYRKSIVEAGEAGLVWDVETLTAYLQDPNGFLRETLDSNRARSGMAFQVRDEGEAQNLAAFLATFSEPDS